MDKNSVIFVAGHRGLVGSAILKNLQEKGFNSIVTKTRDEVDLLDASQVASFFEKYKPEYVFLAAAKVGGIMANNTYRADFIYENICIQNNVIHNSFVYKVKKLLFLGSTCIYPKDSMQPIKEEYLLTNVLEYTNEPYAIAKIAGMKMCESYNIQYATNFMSVMPTNLYGPNDNFDLGKSHVLPALMRKIHLAKLLANDDFQAIRDDLKVSSSDEAKRILEEHGIRKNEVEIWGSGKPMREFLWSEDMADACVFIMQNVNFEQCYQGKAEIRNTHINIGTGKDISIKDLAFLIKDRVGYKGQFVFNSDKPDGTMKKLTDSGKLNQLGWNHKIEIEEGIQKMYNWYCSK
jgi:GDP-L-fucose synthase